MGRNDLGRGYRGSAISGGGASDVRFVSPVPPFPALDLPSVLAPGEQSTAAGLSKPRLANARKKRASSRVRVNVISGTEDETGFNPFRYGAAVAASDAPGPNEFGGTHGHQEKFIGRNPFHAKEEEKVSENSESGKFESLKHGVDAGGFVFRSGCKTSSRFEQSTEYRSSELEHSDYESNPTSRNLGAENTAFSHDRSGCDAAADIFLLGRELKEDTSFGQTMPVVDPNFGNFASTKSESSGFDFGAASSANFNRGNTGDLSKKASLDTFSLVDNKEKSLKPNLATESFGNLDFGSSQIGKSKSVPFTGEVINSLKSGRPNKLSSETSAFVDRTPMHSDSIGLSTGDTLNCGKLLNPGVPFVNSFVPRKLENTFVFGANSTRNSDSKDSVAKSTRQPVKSGICDDFSSIFNSRVRICSNPVDSSFKASDSPSFSSLHDQMEKLNLQNSDDAILFERINQGKEDTRLNSANFFVFGNNNSALSSFHAELEKLNLQTPVDNINTERGNQTVESAKLNSINPFMSHESVPSSFQNVMEKLDLQSSGDDFASQKRNQDDDSTKHDPVDVFVFGECFPSNLHDEMEKMNLQDSGDDISSEMRNQADESTKHKMASSFVFVNDKSSLTSSACSPVNPSAEKDNKVEIHRELESDNVRTVFNFTGMPEQAGIAQTEFRSSKTTEDVLKESLFSGRCQNMPFIGRKGDCKDFRMRKRNSKLKNIILPHQTFAQTFSSIEEVFESKYPDSVDCCLSKDYSPYKENLVAEPSLREDSVPSGKSKHVASTQASIDTQKSIHLDESECLISTTQNLNNTGDDPTHGELNQNDSVAYLDREFGLKYSEKFVPKSETEDVACGSSIAATESEPLGAGQGGTCFTFNSSVEDFDGENFMFGASSLIQSPLSASKYQYRKKNKMKVVHEILNPISNIAPMDSSINILQIPSKSMQPNHARGKKNVSNTGDGTNTSLEVKKEFIISDPGRVAEQEACEKWRLRGNQAYAEGHLLEAEEYYTRGLNSIFQKENTQSCNQALMLCYSNRSAARISLGRMRDALNDCMLAIAIDSSFLRAQVRAASCHLTLGEVDEAINFFNDCLLSKHDGNLDEKILTQSSDGLQNAQQVADHMSQAEELLLKRTSDGVTKALQLISESLIISAHSEKLMAMKAEALLMLQRYEEVINFCEQTMGYAEVNALSSGANLQSNKEDNSVNLQFFPLYGWRWLLKAKANFYLGRLDQAFELLKKLEQGKSIVDKDSSKSDSSTSLYASVCELLRLKAAGNQAFKEGRHLDAIKHYSAALAFNIESRPFAAICLCNRAAAYQSVGQITDAIADCSLAIALDATYPKALSRRASLYERIRDYEQASNDLRRLVSLLEKQIKVKDNQAGTLESAVPNQSDLCQARLWLSIMEEEARKDIPLDMCLILGIEASSSVADIKKAYRKAALRHHPDKAGQILARSENLDKLRREVTEEVHRDADRLFKIIGEAYAVLLEPARNKPTKL
ncbi:uncharacterized protein LOC122052602 [Zingiber officinale]|uniref:uncharacterized protein LOC122052602 n=1 Tax=Zingiber officinale TaxID=94328 RepID=UPI001C4AB9B3|nr:uncharacterized protein LOC122052602 [Zingiber officinale]